PREPEPEREPRTEAAVAEALPEAPVEEADQAVTELVPAPEPEPEPEAEAAEADLFSVEHAAGRFKVPEGSGVMEGHLLGGRGRSERPPARGDRDRCADRVRPADRGDERAGRGEAGEGGRGRPHSAGDGGPLRAAPRDGSRRSGALAASRGASRRGIAWA